MDVAGWTRLGGPGPGEDSEERGNLVLSTVMVTEETSRIPLILVIIDILDI
jgi:hypothetical protein